MTERVKEEGAFLVEIEEALGRVLVGQKGMVRGLLIGLLADGHVLLEGLPGLAKTLAISSLAEAIGGVFHRLQFTPDLLPADLIGTQVYNPKTGDWSVREGPLFANLILADEVNRAPAKVQSALLEAMQERQVTLAGETRLLPQPFLVMATQNPVEQEGTYPLPEAQVDRFLLKLIVEYPTREEEIEIVKRMGGIGAAPKVPKVTEPDRILQVRKVVEQVYLDEKVLGYIVDLVFATRDPERVGLKELAPMILYGASPRASIGLSRCSKAQAFLEGRGYVTPQDVKAVAPYVLGHRMHLTFEAEAEERTSMDLLQEIMDHVPVP
ncbi:MAG TPA: MoxR family ATPase [Planctomycetes bacterium]|nr:MoxR family ATPase [Planctomycetota bacterium]